MEKEKQIEEMAKVLNECCNRYDENGRLLGNKCSNCECWCDTNHLCTSYNTKEATALYNAGYRKETQGEWQFWKVPSYSVSVTHEIICSICGYRAEMLKGRHYNYCPNCGAKMRGE